ncbi:MAG: type II secretion system F family protein [DPANN group archaeon]|nr:type II secretion system F family protein [DPANN group archaeon]
MGQSNKEQAGTIKGITNRANKILKIYDKKTLNSALTISVIGFILFIFNQFVLSLFLLPPISLIIMLFSIVSMVVPLISLQYKHFQKMKNIESNFPNFIKAISEGLSSNMSLPQSVKYAAKSNFGELSPYINMMVSQMSWGISFEKAFHGMAESINNRLITRATSTIIEAHTYGGKISTAMAAIGESITDIEKLRRERISSISSQMMQGYIIFFVFIGVMIGLVVFLLPILGSDTLGGTGVANANLVSEYTTKFRHLSVIQGFFSGIAIGKLSEGSISAGFKHAAIMSFIGYAALLLTTL